MARAAAGGTGPQPTTDPLERIRTNSAVSLNLWEQHLDVDALALHVSTNTCLRTLTLRGNAMCDRDCAKLLAAGLLHNRSITSLGLADSAVGEAASMDLAYCLKKNPVLCTLDLWANGLGDAGASAVAAALETADAQPPCSTAPLPPGNQVKRQRGADQRHRHDAPPNTRTPGK